MSTPGFTAEASLRLQMGRYRSVARAVAAWPARVAPQQVGPLGRRGLRRPGGLDRGRRPIYVGPVLISCSPCEYRPCHLGNTIIGDRRYPIYVHTFCRSDQVCDLYIEPDGMLSLRNCTRCEDQRCF